MRIGLPWHWPARGGDGAAGRLRSIARWHRFRHRPAWQRVGLGAVTALLWPAGALGAALRPCLDPRGARPDPSAPPGGLAGALRCYAAALRHNVQPWEWRGLALWSAGASGRIDEFLYSSEAPGLMRALNRPGAVNPLDDKLAFHDLCVAEGVPTPAVLAYWEDGAAVRRAPHPVGDAPDGLWLKPRRGVGGRGQEPWRGSGDPDADAGALADHLARRSRQVQLLVQPQLANHALVAPVTNGALVVIRILSGRGPDGAVRIVDAVAMLPCGPDRRTRGMHGLLAPVDPESGRLEPACRAVPVRQAVTAHPDTGVPIAGRALPDWPEALRQVGRAHAAVGGFAFVGWDVALTPGGPFILEGNEGWGAFLHQGVRRPAQPLLADPVFRSIVDAWLDAGG